MGSHAERGARGGSARTGRGLSPRRAFAPAPGRRAAVPAAGAAGPAPGVRRREPAAAGALGDAQGIMRELLITQGFPRYLKESLRYLFVRRAVDAVHIKCGFLSVCLETLAPRGRDLVFLRGWVKPFVSRSTQPSS